MQLRQVIQKLQIEMNAQGENLTVDGVAGPKTLAALAKFDGLQIIVSKILSSVPKAPTTDIDLEPGLELIKEFEGLFLQAYRDPVGIPTIGWGTIQYPDGRGVQMGDTCTVDQATEYLMFDIQGFVESVKHLVQVPISNNSFCALVSFCYNLGAGALGRSNLLKKLNAGEPKEWVAEEFGQWVYAGGNVLPGLVRRREAEKQLFLS